MALDEQAKALLDIQAKNHLEDSMGEANLSMDFSDPVAEREKFKVVALSLARPTLPVSRIENRNVPRPGGEVPVRIYWPDAAGTKDNLSCIVYCHGGGWVVGDLDTHDAIMREICVLSEMVVVSVDYRLAPEHPFPAGLEDCCAAVRWVRANAGEIGINPDRVGVAGESAGGNVAAGVAVAAIDDPSIKLAAQFLFYPNTCALKNFTTPSREELGDDGQFYPTRAQIEGVNSCYCATEEDRKNPLVSPLLKEGLRGIAPALIVTGGYDTLRDEGKMYADKLTEQGIRCDYVCLETTIHGFLNFGKALDISTVAFELFAEKAKEYLNA